MATKTTITEALAEIDTLKARMTKKGTSILAYLVRPTSMVDPLEKEGLTSKTYVERELQSFLDMAHRIGKLRQAIRKSNEVTQVTVEGRTDTIAAWIEWRREIEPLISDMYDHMRDQISQSRRRPQPRRDDQSWMVGISKGANEPGQDSVTVSYDETELIRRMEEIVTVMGVLDGRLSLANATTIVEVED